MFMYQIVYDMYLMEKRLSELNSYVWCLFSNMFYVKHLKVSEVFSLSLENPVEYRLTKNTNL